MEAWTKVGILGPTNSAQPLFHFQLWPLVPVGEGLQPLVRSHTGLVGYESFFCPASLVGYVRKQVDSSPSVGILSYSLGHCGQSCCVPVLESSGVKTEIRSVYGSLAGPRKGGCQRVTSVVLDSLAVFSGELDLQLLWVLFLKVLLP